MFDSGMSAVRVRHRTRRLHFGVVSTSSTGMMYVFLLLHSASLPVLVYPLLCCYFTAAVLALLTVFVG